LMALFVRYRKVVLVNTVIKPRNLVTLFVSLFCIFSLVGCGPSAEDKAKADAIDEITTTSGAAILTCENYLSGEINVDLASSVLESYDEDVDKEEEDALNECGIYTSCGLYAGQLKATLSSWNKLKYIENPEDRLRSDIDSLQQEIDRLEEKRPTNVK
jgi:hypothetical protein